MTFAAATSPTRMGSRCVRYSRNGTPGSTARGIETVCASRVPRRHIHIQEILRIADTFTAANEPAEQFGNPHSTRINPELTPADPRRSVHCTLADAHTRSAH